MAEPLANDGSGNARTQAAGAASVLVVDGDRVSRRFVELSLGAQNFSVETANDASAALEVLSTQAIDLIVSETTLTDMNGLRFYRRLQQENRLRSLPFVFLSSDANPKTKVLAFRAGVDDYICKPCDPSEFCARVAALVDRQRRLRNDARNKSYTLAGDFSAIPFPDLVSIIEMGQRSGLLSVLNADACGQVFFDGGRIVHCIYKNLRGAEAFCRFMWDPDGQFEFTPGECTLAANERTIAQSTTGLVLEAARQLDTARKESHSIPTAAGPDSVNTSLLPAAPRFPAPSPHAGVARHYELCLGERFALGDLRLFSEADLHRWTRSEGGRDRFHVLLVAALDEAVSALLPLAGAPTERFAVDSLTPGKKVLGLSFHLRDERLLDVVLVDARDPSALAPHLARCPSVVVFAPPKGDVMSLGSQARVALHSFLRDLMPRAVLGVGLPSLEESLASIGIRSNDSRLLCCVRGALSDPHTDLRRLLIHAIRLWLSSGASTEDGRGAVA